MYIRPIHIQDYAAWHSLWQAYTQFYKVDLSPEITEHLWQQFFQETATIYAFVVESEPGQPQGFVHCVLHPCTWDIRPCCYLEDLFVTEQARGSGLGRALIEHVQAFAQEKNCTRVYWVTNKNNIQAQNLYEQLATRMDFIQYRVTF